MSSSSSIVHVQGCPARQIFSKQKMSPIEFSSCPSCHVFSYYLAQFFLLSTIFVFTTKTTQPHPQVFSVNSALTCKKAAFLMSSVDQSQNSSKFGHLQLHGYGELCVCFQPIRIGEIFCFLIMLLKRKEPLLRELVAKLKRSSYVQVTIICNCAQPVCMRYTVTQFACESVGLCPFHGSYVK